MRVRPPFLVLTLAVRHADRRRPSPGSAPALSAAAATGAYAQCADRQSRDRCPLRARRHPSTAIWPSELPPFVTRLDQVGTLASPEQRDLATAPGGSTLATTCSGVITQSAAARCRRQGHRRERRQGGGQRLHQCQHDLARRGTDSQPTQLSAATFMVIHRCDAGRPNHR